MVNNSPFAEQADKLGITAVWQHVDQSINQTFSEDDALRKAGEQSIQSIKSTNPNALVLSMALLLCDDSKASNVKQFAAIMLRQYVCVPLTITKQPNDNSPSNSTTDIWLALPPSTQHLLRQVVLDRLLNENDASVANKLVDLMAMVASRTCNNESYEALEQAKKSKSARQNNWPELLPAIFSLSTNQSNQAKIELMIRCIEKIVETIDIDVLRPELLSISRILETGIQINNQTNQSNNQSNNQPIRMSSLRALINLMLALDQREAQLMVKSIDLMFRSLEQSYVAIINQSNNQSTDDSTEADEELLLNGIQALSDLAHEQPTLLRAQLDRSLTFMSTVVQSNKQSNNQSDVQPINDEIRGAAFEYLLALSASGGMIRKSPKYVPLMIPLCFQVMTELDGLSDQSINQSVKSTIDGDVDEFDDYSMFKIGREGLYRVCQGLSIKVLPVALPLIDRLISGSAWTDRFAALTGLGEICSELADKIDSLDRLLGGVLGLLAHDPSMRVRCAAAHVISCVVEKSEEIDEFHNKYHALVLPALITQFAHPHPALLSAVGGAVRDFTSDMNADVLNTYAPALFNALMPLIQTQALDVQESVVGVLSSLISVLSEEFKPYYEVMWPSIECILVAARAPEHRGLLAKAIECAGVIAEAVGHDTFAPKAAPLMEMLVSIQRAESSTTTRDINDELPSMLVTCQARVARCLKSNFKPYLQYVIPPLLASASIVNEYALLDSNCSAEQRALADMPGYETQTLNVDGSDGLRLTLNPSMFEEKATACHMLYQYAEDLKGDYVDYAVDTARVLIPLMQYKFHESVRIAACAACPALLHAVNEGWATQPARRDEVATQLLNAMFDAFLAVCNSEAHLEQLTGHLEVFYQSIDALNQSPTQRIRLTTTQCEQASKFIADMVTESVKRQDARAQRRLLPDFDEQEAEDIDNENKEEEEMLGYIYSLCAALIRVGGQDFLPFYDSTLHPVFSGLYTSSSVELVTLGICVEAQLINDCELPVPLKQSYCTALYEVCCRHALSTVVDLRQSACYGIGACARRLGTEFAPVVAAALPLLVKVIEGKKSRSEDNAPATDNAVSSYVKILSHCADAPFVQQQHAALWGKFLDYLPCGGDEAEAKIVHDVLIERCLKGDPALCGPQGEKVKAIIVILANLLDSDYLSESGHKGAITLIKQWAQQMGQQSFNEILQMLDQDDRESLQKALSS